MNDIDQILEDVICGERLSDEDTMALFNSYDLIKLGQAANAMRIRKHPSPVVTYIIDRNINYTNVCVAGCLFCAFYKTSGDVEGYTLSNDEIDKKIEETQSLDGVQILMQGGLHPDYKIEWYEELISGIKERTGIHIHAFSPPEIIHIAQLSNITIDHTKPSD